MSVRFTDTEADLVIRAALRLRQHISEFMRDAGVAAAINVVEKEQPAKTGPTLGD